MTDKQTLQWWIDHARELEEELRLLRDYSRNRDQRIVSVMLERNSALSKTDQWGRACLALAERLVSADPTVGTRPEFVVAEAYERAAHRD